MNVENSVSINIIKVIYSLLKSIITLPKRMQNKKKLVNIPMIGRIGLDEVDFLAL